MRFIETPIPGVRVIEPECVEDARGFLARTFCELEFRTRGLADRFVQCSVSYNHRKGTLRGMHFQFPPAAEAKLIRCTAGAVFDVALDLRAASPQLTKWFAVELTAKNRKMLYIPKGCAHGFQTLVDDCEVFYQMSEAHDPAMAGGVRWDDPVFAVAWPHEPHRFLSEKDRMYPNFLPAKEALHL